MGYIFSPTFNGAVPEARIFLFGGVAWHGVTWRGVACPNQARSGPLPDFRRVRPLLLVCLCSITDSSFMARRAWRGGAGRGAARRALSVFASACALTRCRAAGARQGTLLINTVVPVPQPQPQFPSADLRFIRAHLAARTSGFIFRELGLSKR